MIGSTVRPLAGMARAVAAGTRGAVYVEFLVAFLPLFVFFDCLLQLCAVHAARLVTEHAAACAVRAAVVVLPDDPAAYGGAPVGAHQGSRQSAIERAAAIPLGAVGGIVARRVTLIDAAGSGPRLQVGPADRLTVRVEADYQCGFPLARHVVCAPGSGRTTLVAHASLPNHGARYVYD